MVRTREQGITLIEVIIALSIITIMLVVVGYSVMSYVHARTELLDDVKTAYLAEEGFEIVRALRDADWTAFEVLAIGGDHYLAVATTTVAFSATPEFIGTDFFRTVTVANVYRDADDDIVPSTEPGATLDPESRLVTVSAGGPTGTSSFSGILTNLNAL